LLRTKEEAGAHAMIVVYARTLKSQKGKLKDGNSSFLLIKEAL
jgi:hypothetical protein